MNEMYIHTYYDPEWVLKQIKDNNYFRIGEFVSDAVLSKYGEARCWSFIDPRLLANMLYIRSERGNGITVNHGGAQQRGLRENTCPIVRRATNRNRLYLSAHVRGGACDFHEKKATAEEIRQWIEAHAEELPYPCRLEWKMMDEEEDSETYGEMVPITWVHIDVAHVIGQAKVYKFNV
jgi:hypothetical protein